MSPKKFYVNKRWWKPGQRGWFQWYLEIISLVYGSWKNIKTKTRLNGTFLMIHLCVIAYKISRSAHTHARTHTQTHTHTRLMTEINGMLVWFHAHKNKCQNPKNMAKDNSLFHISKLHLSCALRCIKGKFLTERGALGPCWYRLIHSWYAQGSSSGMI